MNEKEFLSHICYAVLTLHLLYTIYCIYLLTDTCIHVLRPQHLNTVNGKHLEVFPPQVQLVPFLIFTKVRV